MEGHKTQGRFIHFALKIRSCEVATRAHFSAITDNKTPKKKTRGVKKKRVGEWWKRSNEKEKRRGEKRREKERGGRRREQVCTKGYRDWENEVTRSSRTRGCFWWKRVRNEECEGEREKRERVSDGQRGMRMTPTTINGYAEPPSTLRMLLLLYFARLRHMHTRVMHCQKKGRAKSIQNTPPPRSGKDFFFFAELRFLFFVLMHSTGYVSFVFDPFPLFSWKPSLVFNLSQFHFTIRKENATQRNAKRQSKSKTQVDRQDGIGRRESKARQEQWAHWIGSQYIIVHVGPPVYTSDALFFFFFFWVFNDPDTALKKTRLQALYAVVRFPFEVVSPLFFIQAR